jgi:hypothetical protein
MVEDVVIVIVTPSPRAVTLEFDTLSEPAEEAPLSNVPLTLPGLSGFNGWVRVVVPWPLGPERIGAAVGVTGLEMPSGDVAVGEVDVATTLNVYVVPLVRPVTKQEVPVVTHVAPPGPAVIVYFTPLSCDASVGATNVTSASESPATATTPVGVSPDDAVDGVTVKGMVTVSFCPLLVTVMVTGNVPDTAGIPETTPALEHESPAGRPEHVQVAGPVAPVTESVVL